MTAEVRGPENPHVSRLLQMANDVESNPGPGGLPVKLNGHLSNNPRNGSGGKRRYHDNANNHGTGAFIPKEALMTINDNSIKVKTSSSSSSTSPRSLMAAKQEKLEKKLDLILQELSQYREAATEIAEKNQLISHLESRVSTLEEVVHMNRGGGGSGGCGRGDGGDGGGLKLEYQHSGERLKSIEERLRVQEQEMAAAKVDLGEVMHVYDDIQDRLYDIDRTWKNNLCFYGIKLDSHSLTESPECLETKIRHVLKNKLNIGREIVVMRCQRIFNGVDTKGNRPIVVNFQKWSDKEEILRKAKILKNSGITVEEDFSRAAKLRRKELEKLVKEVKAIDPDKKCLFKYDKLLIDDHVFVYNDVERRIERLPFTVSGHSTGLAASAAPGAADPSAADANSLFPQLLPEDMPSATLGRHRPNRSAHSGRTHVHCSTTSLAPPPRPAWRTKSVESILGRIPHVTNGVNAGAYGCANNVLRALTASVSTPSLVARERAKMWACEKMTPNLGLETGGDEEDQEDLVKEVEDAIKSQESPEELEEEEDGYFYAQSLPRELSSKYDASSDHDDEEYLPLNNVVDWDDWNRTGTNVEAHKKSNKEASTQKSPKLKLKYAKKSNNGNSSIKMLSRSNGKRDHQQTK